MSFEEHYALLHRAGTAIQEAAGVALEAEAGRWYEASQATVPVGVDLVVGKTTVHVAGTLKESGKVLELHFDGFKAVGGVSYGNEATVTTWHGVGYEVFVDQGTSKMAGRFFLTKVVMEATNGMGERLGASMWQAFAERMAV